MPPKSSKAPVKGQKQIKEENEKTMKFYTYITVLCYVPFLIFKVLPNYGDLPNMSWVLVCFSVVINGLSIKSMSSMAASKLDLNMEQGMGEYIKDVIFVTALCQVLCCFTNYFWLLWLVIPCVAFYKLWVNIIAPWIFQEPPEVNEKKNKKLERKMKRAQH